MSALEEPLWGAQTEACLGMHVHWVQCPATHWLVASARKAEVGGAARSRTGRQTSLSCLLTRDTASTPAELSVPSP